VSNTTQQVDNRKVSPMTPLQVQAHEDLEGVIAYYVELEPQYRGEHVLLWKKRVFAHGTDLEDLYRRAAMPEHSHPEGMALFRMACS
jgi:hypothetical protein